MACNSMLQAGPPRIASSLSRMASDLEARFAQMQRHDLGDGVVVFREQQGAHVHDAATADMCDRLHIGSAAHHEVITEP